MSVAASVHALQCAIDEHLLAAKPDVKVAVHNEPLGCFTPEALNRSYRASQAIRQAFCNLHHAMEKYTITEDELEKLCRIRDNYTDEQLVKGLNDNLCRLISSFGC